MTLLLVILIVLLLFGGGYGYRTGYVAYNPAGIILVVLLVLIVLAIVGGPHYGWWRVY